MAIKVGFVTIGQSPRDDVVPEIAAMLGPGIQVLERGALDGLLKEEIQRLRPDKGDFPLITRLRDGQAAVVGKKKITPLLGKKIRQLANLETRVIALLCTDEFPRLKRWGNLLLPSQLLFQAAVCGLEKGTLGVFAPLDEQVEATKRKWEKTGLRVIVEALNPYLDLPEYDQAIERMRREKAGLVVLDCIGYSKKTKEIIEHLLRKPALWPRSVLARAIQEFL